MSPGSNITPFDWERKIEFTYGLLGENKNHVVVSNGFEKKLFKRELKRGFFWGGGLRADEEKEGSWLDVLPSYVIELLLLAKSECPD